MSGRVGGGLCCLRSGARFGRIRYPISHSNWIHNSRDGYDARCCQPRTSVVPNTTLPNSHSTCKVDFSDAPRLSDLAELPLLTRHESKLLRRLARVVGKDSRVRQAVLPQTCTRRQEQRGKERGKNARDTATEFERRCARTRAG